MTQSYNGSPAVPARKASGGGTILVVAALVAVAGLAFASGRLTAPAPEATTPAVGGFPGAGGLPGSVSLQGEVVSIDSTTVTVKLANGTTIDVPLDSATTFHRAQSGTVSDVSAGSPVIVQPGDLSLVPAASQSSDGVPGTPAFGPAKDITVLTP